MSDTTLSGRASETLREIEDFANPAGEWRRRIAEFLGTFFLVLVAAGAGMMAAAYSGTISRTAAVVAPGLMVAAIILFMGKISGAHLNPAVSFAFAFRGDFPWSRVPAYVVAQVLGGLTAIVFLQWVLGVSASNGGTYPAEGTADWVAFVFETVLTFGLVSVILGTASGAQSIGPIGALAVGGYIALAGLWASPPSGASMNPGRSLTPDIVANDYTGWWVYVAGPFLGAALAVLMAYVLRGPGGGLSALMAAEGVEAAQKEVEEAKSAALAAEKEGKESKARHEERLAKFATQLEGRDQEDEDRDVTQLEDDRAAIKDATDRPDDPGSKAQP
ncbi:MAG: aquaporin [bacterium]